MAGNDVLFIDFESDAATVTERLLMFGATPEAIREHFTYIRPEVDPRASTELPAWHAMLGRSYVLAVIDGVTDSLGVFGYSSKDNDDVAAWMRVLPKNIATRTGAAVAVIDHVTKDSDSRGRFAIGAQAKMSGLTGSGYTVEVAEPLGRGLRGVIVLRVGKDRPGYVRGVSGPMRKTDRTQEAARITVDSTVDPDRPVVTVGTPRDAESLADDARAFRFTGYMERISMLLEADSEPLTGNRIDGLVSGKRADIMQALDSLVAEGYVARRDGANRSKMHTSVKPYRQTEDRASDRYSGSGTTQPAEDAPQVVRVVPTYREGGWEPPEQVVPENQGTTREPPGTTQICELCPREVETPGRDLCSKCDTATILPGSRLCPECGEPLPAGHVRHRSCFNSMSGVTA
jgi:hypothetical protein